MKTPFVVFDDARANRAFILQDFVYQDELSPKQLPNLDDYLQRAWANDYHCALFADYEFGLALQKLANLGSGKLNLLWFKNRQEINMQEWLSHHAGQELAGVSHLNMNVSEAEYHAQIQQIHAAIARGEVYQINHTVRLQGASYGNPIRLYQRLRQNVPYAVLASLPNQTWTLCFSPELFLNIQKDGKIITEPMKGTAPRETDPEQLKNDPKNRAENVMIVDLLRNDLGKLAQTGGVSVPAPFEVNAFGSVWQMTSRIVAQMKQGITAANIVQAAFPCGSITGAPKRKSMQWIAQLESTPRGLYTGSIGYLIPEPNSTLGFSGCLNVVIRTLQLTPQQGHFAAEYGVGSGIVIDSNAADEYAECGWKARFVHQLTPECGLFETMRSENGHIAWLVAHLNRMTNSAVALNIPFDRAAAHTAIAQILAQLPHQAHRIRLNLSPTGTITLDHAPLSPLNSEQTVIISDIVLPRHDYLRRHKTTHRPHFDRAWQTAQQHDAFDALIFNEDGFLLEGGRSSVMVLYQNQWLIPDSDLDILPSIARQKLPPNFAQSAHITRQMLADAQEIRLGNALRGWFRVQLREHLLK